MKNKLQKKISMSCLATGAFGFSMALSTCVSAQALNLSSVPLQATGRVEPNLMILLDSSGSMNHILVPESYDASASYASCTTPLVDPGTISVRIDKTTGVVQFDAGGGGWLTWNAGTNCFANGTGDSATYYDARLYADSNNEGVYFTTSGYGEASYTGHFLNWYFSKNSGGAYIADSFIDGVDVLRAKQGTERRTDVAKTAAKLLINGFQDLRVGLAQFNGSDGAKILHGLDSVSSGTVRNELLAEVDGVSADGRTPLAEALADIGYYFVDGYADKSVTIHPGAAGEAPVLAGSVLGQNSNAGPAYANAADKPTTASPAIQAYCQANFVLGLTDGEPSSDSAYTTYLSDYDGDGNSAGEDALDDVAQALYEIDWRPDLDEGTEEYKNNITSYFIGFADESLRDNALLKSAGEQGGGSYQYADNASSLLTSLNDAVSSFSSSIGTQASVAFNSTSLDIGSVIYSAQFDTSDFSGKLYARSLDPDTGRVSTTLWEASEKLADETSSSRQIVTSIAGVGVPFQAATSGVDGDPTDSGHENDLNIDDTTGNADAAWADRLAYLRGDTSKDGTGNYRDRGEFTTFETVDSGVSGSKVLGDIVHSTPIYVGEPQLNWPTNFGGNELKVQGQVVNSDVGSYESFRLYKKNRTEMVYIGANDGMLHGFNADTGEEEFAYIPELVLDTARYKGLHAYTHEDYGHNYYVDLTPTVSDAYISPNGGATERWTTVLVGGLRGGGKGYFALNVTEPSTLTEANAADIVMWEFDGATDANNLGFSYSEAQIAKLNNDKWAVIFGNGYKSTNGVAGLFVVYIEEGADGSWDAGDWKFISTGVGTDGSGRENGLSSPRMIDLNGDSIVDRVYAGDLMGNMWSFDLSDTSDANWGVYGGKALFTAGADAGQPDRAIMAAPLVARNTAVEGTGANVLVMFGTGQYLNSGDLSDNGAGSFYAVWDNGHTQSGASLTAANLADIYLENDGTARKVDSDNPNGQTLDWATYHGWELILDAGNYDSVSQLGYAGERVISSPTLRRNTVFFSTVSPSAQPCASSGTGWLMSLDFRTGNANDKAVADFNGDGEVNADDNGYVGVAFDGCLGSECDEDTPAANPGLPGQSGFIGDVRCTPGSSGDVICDDIDVGREKREGRLSWEEFSPR